MASMIELNDHGGRPVYINTDEITYLARLEIGPCKTRIHFNGDRSNSVDVCEDIETVAKRIMMSNRISLT